MKFDDGTIQIVGFTHRERDDLMPPTKSAVRAECYIGGWSLEPVPGNPNACKGTLMTELDLQGSLPQSVIKIAHKQ